MGMFTEGQIIKATQETNAILVQLVAEVRRTNSLLEWLGQITAGNAQDASWVPPTATL